MLASRYEIKQELGKGGMGVVYRGYDTRLKRAVAIKFISDSELGTEGRVRLMAEAQAVAQLNHPNIVTIFDAVNDTPPFIVMEIVEGNTLRQTPIKDLAQAIEITRQICLALEHAHKRNIIHRDLKPENVIVLSDGSIKLMDFGLARTPNATRITASGAFIGTVSYAAPELLQGQEPSPQSDLYALGIMLFEMLTGESPFRGSDFLQIISQHLHAPIPSPNKIRHDIPDALNALVMQLLEKRPEDRLASAGKVKEQIVSIQVQQNRSTQPPSSSTGNMQAILELANKRHHVQNDWDKEWRRKGYIKSSLPVLESVERELILSNQAKEIKRGIEHLKNHRLLVITGMPGIGKSTLARAILEFMPPQSPPPFWHDFERQRSSGNSLGVLLDRISSYLQNCLGGDVRQEVMSFRQTPGGKASIHEVDLLIDYLNHEVPIWLVFDNLETVLARGANGFDDPELELLFAGLKSNIHNAKVIITNPFIPILHDGQYLLEFGAQPLNLQGLDEKSSVNYLRVYGLEEFSEETLTALARTASGHPFTLNHIAHYVQSMGVNQELDILLAGLEEITSHFKLSLEHRLSAEEFSALQALSVLNREISLEGLRQTANTTQPTIKRLRDEGLLQTNDTGKFWLHNIVRTSLSTTQVEVTQPAHKRALKFYQNQKTPSIKQSIDDYVNVLEWHHHAIGAGDAEASYKALFVTGLDKQLTKWNEYKTLIDLCLQTELIVNNAQINLSNAHLLQLHQTLGLAYYYLNNYSEALRHLQTALDFVEENINLELKIDLFVYLGYAYYKRGELIRAMDLCQKALELIPGQNENILFAKTLHLRGILRRRQGELNTAIEDLEMALRIFKSFQDEIGIGNTTGDLGNVYYYKKQYSKAIDYYRQAIISSETQQNILGVIIGHFNIGDFMLYDEQYELAKQEFELAVNMSRKKRLFSIEQKAGFNLVDALISLGETDRAEEELNRLQSVLKKVSTPCSRGLEFVYRAQICSNRNQYEKALDYFNQGLDLLEVESCDSDQSGRVYLAFAEFMIKKGQPTKARIALKKGEEIFSALHNDLGLKLIETCLKSIGI